MIMNLNKYLYFLYGYNKNTLSTTAWTESSEDYFQKGALLG